MSGAGDQGLQPERTRLAWRRTALGGTAVALLTARLALTTGDAGLGALLTALSLLGWLALLAAAFRRLRAMGPGQPAPVLRAVALAALTVGYAGLGIVSVLASAPG